jgi:hypothetical protein
VEASIHGYALYTNGPWAILIGEFV